MRCINHPKTVIPLRERYCKLCKLKMWTIRNSEDLFYFFMAGLNLLFGISGITGGPIPLISFGLGVICLAVAIIGIIIWIYCERGK